MTREERAYNYASKKKTSKFTVGEIAKHYDDGYSDGKKEVINKACKWFYEQLFEGTMECKNIEALITDFKIKMEE